MGEVVSPVVPLEDDRVHGVRVLLKRDDLIWGEISGNKWRKLKYNVGALEPVLTFGGEYSNHIRAVAAAGERYGFATVGVIRGGGAAAVESGARVRGGARDAAQVPGSFDISA